MNVVSQIVAKFAPHTTSFRTIERKSKQVGTDLSDNSEESITEDQKCFTFEEVFGDLCQSNFTSDEATEYLEMTPAQFQEIQSRNSIVPKLESNGKQWFSFMELSELKRKLAAPQD